MEKNNQEEEIQWFGTESWSSIFFRKDISISDIYPGKRTQANKRQNVQ
jgi:hypothetical protein